MRVPMCRVHSVGDLTNWAKQLIEALQTEHIIEVDFEDSVESFAKSISPPYQLPIVFVENTIDSRKLIAKLRASGKRHYLVWFGKNFTKEDLVFGVEARVHTFLENARAEDKKLLEAIRKLSFDVEAAEQFEQLIHSLKSLVSQSESDASVKLVLTEFRTAMAKLERSAYQNEFVGGSAELPPVVPNESVSHRQEFGEAMTTVHDLERTGVLWVRGEVSDQEGKVEFLQGKLIAASTGQVRGLKAIYRIFLWDNPRFMFTRRDPQDCILEEHLNVSMKFVCTEGEKFRQRYKTVRRELPPSDVRLHLEPGSLHIGTRLPSEEFSTLSSVVEFGVVNQVVDYNPLPDVVVYEALIALRRNKVIRVG